MMVGLPRSGKSTWIKNNACGRIVISNDWIRANILHAPNNKSIDPALWMITDATLRIMLGQKNDVILDGVHLTKFVRKFFIDVAREYGAKVIFVYMKTPLEECKKRNAFNNKLPDEVLEGMAEKFEEPDCEEYDEITICK